jgi:AAA ATPase-like protein
MDRATNPFAPGAGTKPPELAGRDQILEDARVALTRVMAGRSAKGELLLGLRGVGKTVLLNTIEDLAVGQDFLTVLLETQEDRTLPQLLVPALRRVLLRLNTGERMKAKSKEALQALRAFASIFKVTIGEIEVGIEPGRGTADSGDLHNDLPELLIAIGEAAKESGTAVTIIIDEMQYLTSEDLAALIVSIHKVTQEGLPLLLFGAGLPQLAALAGDAKSYAERLFDYPAVGPLDEDAASDAIRQPIRREGAEIDENALSKIVNMTQGYPYFLQEWGSHVWNTAERSPITAEDVEKATAGALRQLDAGFFRVRMDRLTPKEKLYMRAMAELGPGPHRSGDIAEAMNESVQSVAPLRQGLIKKGMIFSPAYGETAFTVPMFDEFLRRTMADWTPPAAERSRKVRRKK